MISRADSLASDNRGLGPIRLNAFEPVWQCALNLVGALAFFGMIPIYNSERTIGPLIALAISQLVLALAKLPLAIPLPSRATLTAPYITVYVRGGDAVRYSLEDFQMATVTNAWGGDGQKIRLPDGKVLRTSKPGNIASAKQRILYRFLFASEPPKMNEELVADRRLAYMLGRSEFDLEPDTWYRYGVKGTAISDSFLYGYIALIGSLSALNAVQYQLRANGSPGLADVFIWVGGLITAGVFGYWINLRRRRGDRVSDKIRLEGNMLTVVRAWKKPLHIPVAHWSAPQSPTKAVQDFPVNGKIYRLDRSALLPSE